MKHNKVTGYTLSRGLISFIARILLYIWCLFTIVALVWIFISSLKTNREIFSNAWGLFESPQWNNYRDAWVGNSLGRSFINSVIVVGISVLLTVVLSTPTAYVLSRLKFRGRNVVAYYVIFGIGIPIQLMLIPLYAIINDLGLINTLSGLIITYTASSIPLAVFLQISYFNTIPESIAEAARIDGANHFGVFFKVMLPIGRAGVITAAILTFLFLWNEFMFALTFVTSNEKFTLPVGINALNTSMTYTGQWTTLMAGLVITILPTLVVYQLLSRQIIEGLTMGAVKE